MTQYQPSLPLESRVNLAASGANPFLDPQVPTFADMKDRIREKLSQDLAEQHYLDQLRRMTYVDIRL